MACYNPLHAMARKREGSFKKDLVFGNFDENCHHYERDGKVYSEFMLIPCGQCIGCRLEYSRQWAIRCMNEAKMWKNNYFVTLTYRDEHLPCADNILVNESTGEVVLDEITGEVKVIESHPLVPDDLTKFIKLLRRELEYHYNWTGVRFYACGEYGSKYQRPHYHIILFNMPELDLDIYSKRNNFIIFTSNFIDKVWKKGYNTVAEVNFDTCAYVSRYMLKKHKGKDFEFYSDNGLVPEFTRCSRRGGIGQKYFEDNWQRIYAHDEDVLSTPSGVRYIKPPKYYDKLFDIDHAEYLSYLKQKRKESAEAALASQLANSSLTKEQYLKQKLYNKSFDIKNKLQPWRHLHIDDPR